MDFTRLLVKPAMTEWITKNQIAIRAEVTVSLYRFIKPIKNISSKILRGYIFLIKKTLTNGYRR